MRELKQVDVTCDWYTCTCTCLLFVCNHILLVARVHSKTKEEREREPKLNMLSRSKGKHLCMRRDVSDHVTTYWEYDTLIVFTL